MTVLCGKQKRRSPGISLFVKILCFALSLFLLNGCGARERHTEKTNESNLQTKGEMKMKDFGNVEVGDIIGFGSFDKDGKNETEKEELTWQILSVEGNKALVITTEGVDCQLYNNQAIETDWEKCSLRKWLNDKFLAETFTTEEAAQIATTQVPWEDNPSYPQKPGKAVQDKLFLLSISEAEKYFPSDEERTCKPTSLAALHQVYVDESGGTCMWWLRNSGSAPECAALVNESGSIDHSGDGVYCEGNAVRPAMWIALS